jgi:hypothetical protein
MLLRREVCFWDSLVTLDSPSKKEVVTWLTSKSSESEFIVDG